MYLYLNSFNIIIIFEQDLLKYHFNLFIIIKKITIG
jgi:hypothetical protein